MWIKGGALGLCLIVLLGTANLASMADAQIADAAMKRDIQNVRRLLDQKADPNAVQADGTAALHWAVRWDDLDTAALLLRAGANSNTTNREGATPLYLAAINGSAPMIELLLKNGADPNATILEGAATTLMIAARTGSLDALTVLLDNGADVNAKEKVKGQTALMWAIAEKHADAVKLLLDRGADVEARSIVVPPPVRGRGAQANADPEAGGSGSGAGTGGMTALLFAGREGDLESAKLLVGARANVNQTSAEGSNALLLAILNGHYELAAYLLDQNSNPNAADAKGMASLYAAIDMRNLETSEVPGPKADKLDPMELIKALLARGADPNARLKGDLPYRGASNFSLAWQDMAGATPFLRAAQSGDIQVMRLLLAHGADPLIKTNDNTTALMLAAGMGWGHGQHFEWSEAETLEAVRLCLELGIDVNAVTDISRGITAGGLTALHAAAQKGSNATVELLVKNGGRLDIKDGKGRTPLVWAEGVPVQVARPPWPQPHTAVLIRELMSRQQD